MRKSHTRNTRTAKPDRPPISSDPVPAGAYAAKTAAYASPPCLMHEADPAYLGYMDRDAVLALLNEMLEGERAGAKIAGALREQAADPVVRRPCRAW